MYYFKSYTKYIGDGNSGISLWNLFQTETEIFDETGKISLHELVYGNKMSEQLREIINSINGPVITPYDLCEDIVRGKDKKSISCITDVIDADDISGYSRETYITSDSIDGIKIITEDGSNKYVDYYNSKEEAEKIMRVEAKGRLTSKQDRIKSSIEFVDESFFKL